MKAGIISRNLSDAGTYEKVTIVATDSVRGWCCFCLRLLLLLEVPAELALKYRRLDAIISSTAPQAPSYSCFVGGYPKSKDTPVLLCFELEQFRNLDLDPPDGHPQEHPPLGPGPAAGVGVVPEQSDSVVPHFFLAAVQHVGVSGLFFCAEPFLVRSHWLSFWHGIACNHSAP